MDKYSVNVVWSDEDDCFIATIPEFPTLSAFGDSREQAIKEAETALSAFIEIYNEEERELPIPAKAKEFSGNIRIRIPKSLHAALHELAQREGVSQNTLISHLLSEGAAIERVDRKLERLEKVFYGTVLSDRQQPMVSTESDIGVMKITVLDEQMDLWKL